MTAIDHRLRHMTNLYMCIMTEEYNEIGRRGFKINDDSDVRMLIELLSSRIARIMLNKPNPGEEKEAKINNTKVMMYLKEIES